VDNNETDMNEIMEDVRSMPALTLSLANILKMFSLPFSHHACKSWPVPDLPYSPPSYKSLYNNNVAIQSNK
jgi:hypothetical protein